MTTDGIAFGGLRVRTFAERTAYLAQLDASLDADEATLAPDQVRWRRIGPDAREVLRDIVRLDLWKATTGD